MSSWTPQRRPDILADTLPDGSTVLYDPRTEMVYAISVTAAHVWGACDGTRPLTALVDDLLMTFAADPTRASRDIAALLEQLQSLDLLVTDVPADG